MTGTGISMHRLAGERQLWSNSQRPLGGMCRELAHGFSQTLSPTVPVSGYSLRRPTPAILLEDVRYNLC